MPKFETVNQLKHTVWFFTGQILQQNRNNFQRIKNTVFMFRAPFNDQKWSNLTH